MHYNNYYVFKNYVLFGVAPHPVLFVAIHNILKYIKW